MNGLLNNFFTYLSNAGRGLKTASKLRLSYLRKVFSLMGKREKNAVWTLFAIALVSLFFSVRNFYVAHTKLIPTVGGIYIEGMMGQPQYINPILAHQEIDNAAVNLVYSGLYKYDSDGKLVPDLAESMPVISQDQKQYTISLKKNVRWHNDKPFTADDVVYTIQTLQDPAYKSPLRSNWMSTTVEKLGDYQIRFTTKDISGPFIQHLTLPMMPQAVWSRIEPQNFVLSNYNLDAVGTGPYIIKEIKKLTSGKVQQITLGSFSNYFGGKPKVDTIIIKYYDTDEDMLNALHSKEIEGFGFIPLDRNVYLDQRREGVHIYNLPVPQYQILFFNVNNKILNDQAVRQALAYATDKQNIIDDVFKGNALLPSATSSVGTEITLPPDPYKFSVDKANDLLDQAGWKVDPQSGIRSKKNVAFEITVATNDSLLNSKSAELIQRQWQQLHIKVNLQVIPTKQLTDTLIRPRTFDVLLFPQKLSSDADPFIFWHSSQTRDPGLNITGFTDPLADKLITEGRSTTDQNARKAKYNDFNNLLADKVPVIYLNQTTYLYAVDDRVKNIDLKTLYDSSQRFYDTPNWYMEEKRVWK